MCRDRVDLSHPFLRPPADGCTELVDGGLTFDDLGEEESDLLWIGRVDPAG